MLRIASFRLMLSRGHFRWSTSSRRAASCRLVPVITAATEHRWSTAAGSGAPSTAEVGERWNRRSSGPRVRCSRSMPAYRHITLRRSSGMTVDPVMAAAVFECSVRSGDTRPSPGTVPRHRRPDLQRARRRLRAEAPALPTRLLADLRVDGAARSVRGSGRCSRLPHMPDRMFVSTAWSALTRRSSGRSQPTRGPSPTRRTCDQHVQSGVDSRGLAGEVCHAAHRGPALEVETSWCDSRQAKRSVCAVRELAGAGAPAGAGSASSPGRLAAPRPSKLPSCWSSARGDSRPPSSRSHPRSAEQWILNRPGVSGELWGEKPAGAHHCQSATG
jgi:hypothetical protein